VRIVQCRNWSGEPVGVAAVREFLGAMVDVGLKSGAFMSCGAFTAEAEALARRHGIMAVSGPDLLALVDKRPEALRRELLDVATQGDYRRPTCPRCGQKMVSAPPANAAEAGALAHWVCENAPRCQGTLAWSPGPA
jgi:restriction system protein